MKAVSEHLLKAIRELQKLSSFKAAALGGGTNLALRYHHRTSVDIDLFFDGIIGRAGFTAIEQEVKEVFGESAYGLQYPCEESDQFMFMRFFLKRKGEQDIKVEVLQNANLLSPIEELEGIRLLAETDIATLKLMACANRAAPKDVYDLDYITDRIQLKKLMETLEIKEEKFKDDKYRTIFDLEGEVSPLKDPKLLLKFDEKPAPDKRLPGHSNQLFRILPDQKSWMLAGSSWRRKVKRYCL